jgi:branched-chain amino acid transport system substrate-binding protein
MSRPSMRARFLGTGVAALALLAAGCTDSGAPIVIGVAGSFHAKPMMNNLLGAQLAVEEANANGGIEGRRLEIAIGDDMRSGEQAALVAERFVQDRRVVAVAGHVLSTTMLAAAPLYDGHLAAVATLASAPALTGISPWVFRVAASDDVLGSDLARFVVDQRWTSAAILYRNDPYGRAFASVFADAFSAAGGGSVDAYAVSDEAATPEDMDVYMRTLAARKPDVLLIVSSTAIGVTMLQAARAHRLDIPIIGSDGWSYDLLLAEPAAEGIYSPASFLSDDEDSASVAFRARFRQRFGEEPGQYGAAGYDATIAIIAAIRSAGTDRKRVRDALASQQRAPVLGATGPISFVDGDRAERSGGIVRIQNGKARTYRRWDDRTVPP